MLVKRVFDVVVTLSLAPVVLPIVAVTALVLAIELRGNPFFVQQRIGLHGRPFRMYKLRTMRNLRPGEKESYVVEDWRTFVFSPRDRPNPRVTRLGAIVRESSIDELPNLLNVLKGEMSLVGPRPELLEIVQQYPERYHRRHDVLPGIAGLAQVHGRSDLTYEQIAAYDLEYVERHSVSMDLRILLLTIGAAIRREGAR